MELKDAKVGRKVNYKNIEEGVITSFNSRYIFVRYGSAINSIATSPEDLEYI
jgi:hypothetical protein